MLFATSQRYIKVTILAPNKEYFAYSKQENPHNYICIRVYNKGICLNNNGLRFL